MSRNLILIIAIVLLVIIGSVALLARQRQAKTTDAATGTEQVAKDDVTPPTVTDSDATATPWAGAIVVTYDGTRFSPQSVTVAPGTTVAFTNDSTRSMWVASDPHPTHTNFSDFDAKRAYTPGQSYSFTFDKAGTFTFHDHLNSSVRGTVSVK